MAVGKYTPAQIKEMSLLELLMIRHYQEKEKDEFMDRLGTYLGVLWDVEALKKPKSEISTSTVSNGKIFTPLTMVINPKILEIIQGQGGVEDSRKPFIGGGEYIPKPGQKIVSAGSLSREDFYTLLGRKAPKMAKTGEKFFTPGTTPQKADTPMAFAQEKPTTFGSNTPSNKSRKPRK